MAKKQKSQILFSEQGMRSFGNLSDAFEYFTKEQNGNHSHKSITDLFNKTNIVKIGKVCVNFAQSSNDEKGFQKSMRAIFKTNESHEAFMQIFTEWKNKFEEKAIDLDLAPSDDSNSEHEAEFSGE